MWAQINRNEDGYHQLSLGFFTKDYNVKVSWKQVSVACSKGIRGIVSIAYFKRYAYSILSTYQANLLFVPKRNLKIAEKVRSNDFRLNDFSAHSRFFF